MVLLNKNQILQINDSKYVDVAVPEWGGTVRVRGLTVAEQDSFDRSIVRTEWDEQGNPKTVTDYENQTARLVVRCVVAEDGSRLFEDGDAGLLAAKNAAVVGRLAKAIQDLSGISKKAKDALAKNSVTGQSDGSALNSPGI
jgi:YD repeat-containing protein